MSFYSNVVVDISFSVVDSQYNDIINSSDAWLVAEEGDTNLSRDLRPTVSSRRVKALIEQVTGHFILSLY